MITRCNFVPSLERMSYQRLAASLWTCDEILNVISGYNWSRVNREQVKWHSLEEDVADRAEYLPLPDALKDKLLCFIKPIGLQLLAWIDYLAMHFNFDGALLRFRWSPLGTVDRRKTAETLVKDKNINLITRFKIACTFCLETDISKLWEGLDETFKHMSSADLKYQSEMVSYWIYCMRKKVVPKNVFELYLMYSSHELSIYAEGFIHCFLEDNKSACMYFLEKITEQERHQVLRDTIRRYPDIEFVPILPSSSHASLCNDTLCFLVLSMDEQQLLELFTVHHSKGFPSTILKYFLCWPYQEVFLEMVEQTKGLCTVNDFFNLLSIIVCAISEGYNEHNYELCFMDIWQRIPSNMKINTMGKIIIWNTISICDGRIFKQILQSMSSNDKQRFISVFREELIWNLIDKQKWDILEFFFEECVVSRDSVETIRQQCEQLLRCSPFSTEEKRESVKHKIFKLLDVIALKVDSSSN